MKLKTTPRQHPRTILAFIFTVKINTETLLEMHTYSITILIMVMHLHFTYKDKYTALLQQELQNPYWCLHDSVTTKSYQISTEIYIETIPHVMYFSGNAEIVTKINYVPYQTVQYDEKGMFPAQLMDDTPIQVSLIMEQHLPFSHLVLTINTQYYKNIQRLKVPHPSIQEVA